MGGNPFYTNAEAYAFEILQQKLWKEAQRSAQQTVMELSLLKSFFGQGQFLFCIPFGGTGLPGMSAPFPYFHTGFQPLEPPMIHEPHHPPALPPPPLPAPPPPPPTTSSPPGIAVPSSHQSVVHVNFKSPQVKPTVQKQGSDECNLGKDGINVTIDLREYLPAEIYLNVDEKVVEVKANHVSPQGSKTFARRYDLPACIILDSVRCFLTHDGFLMFSAAWCKME